jgi:hypothetical protein
MQVQRLTDSRAYSSLRRASLLRRNVRYLGGDRAVHRSSALEPLTVDCRVAARDSVTGCLIEDVTGGYSSRALRG